MLGFRAFTAVTGDVLVLVGAGLLVAGFEMWVLAALILLVGTIALLGACTIRD